MLKTSYTHRMCVPSFRGDSLAVTVTRYYIACEHEDEQKHWIKVLTQLVDQAIKQGTAHVNVARHKAPPSVKDRQPILDVLGTYLLFASAVP